MQQLSSHFKSVSLIFFCSAGMIHSMENNTSQSIELAYNTAKNGPLTNEVASTIVHNFLKTDIARCISNFDDTFDKAFPKDIMQHGNDNRLYQTLKGNSWSTCWPIEWKTNHNTSIFSIEDFEPKISTEKTIECAASRYFDNKNFINACKEGFVVLSPCEDFLAFSENKNLFGCVEIHNLETKDEIVLIIPGDFCCMNNKIAFSHDNSCFGILDKEGKIHSIALKQFLDIPLKKMAFSTYYYHQLRDTDKNLLPFFKSIVSKPTFLQSILYKDKINNEEIALVEAISDIVQANTELFPAYMRTDLEDRVTAIKCARSLIDLLHLASKTLHTTPKEIADKLYSSKNLIRAEEDFITRMQDKVDDDTKTNLSNTLRKLHYMSRRIFEFLEKNK